MNWRHALLLLVTLAGACAVFLVPSIAQDPSYHQFADQRTMFGIANALNVLTNLAFVVVGLLGLRWLSRRHSSIDTTHAITSSRPWPKGFWRVGNHRYLCPGKSCRTL